MASFLSYEKEFETAAEAVKTKLKQLSTLVGGNHIK
jgi:hypothetical protein